MAESSVSINNVSIKHMLISRRNVNEKPLLIEFTSTLRLSSMKIPYNNKIDYGSVDYAANV